jgi:hypothetical protein
MSHYDTFATAGISSAGTPARDPDGACDGRGFGDRRLMFSGLTPTTNFLLRIALAFGAGLMMAALL